MTSATMILGALPLVFAAGPGANGREQIGWVIVAGLVLGTLFSLFVVPVAYLLLNKLKIKKIES
jgi:multidrug efflux pump subunit AcrB